MVPLRALTRGPQAPPAAARYDRGAITFHWSMAALVTVVGTLGLVHDSLPEDSQPFWINLHAVIGLAVLALVIARFWWRITHKPPVLPPESGELSRRLSYPVHMLLYVLLFVIPVFGIVTFIWHGRVFDFGLFTVDFGVHKNRAIFHPTEDIHGWLAYALFALIGIHVLAALWHQFYRRDGILLRMWPARRDSAQRTPP
jgi:cytochrome b561